MKRNWTKIMGIGSLIVLVLAIGAASILAQEPDTAVPDNDALALTLPFGKRGFHSSGQSGAIRAEGNTYLADALGISVEDLEAAQETAHIAGLEQAVEAGVLTQEQADWLLSGSQLGFRGFGHMGRFGAETAIDHDALLADALGISVAELDTAKEAAKEAALAQALADGVVTQEQVDLMEARQALKDVIDGEALMADVLGMSVEELQAAREAGTSLPELLEASGLTAEEIGAALQTAHEAAIQQAVEDGVITQAQADLLQDAPQMRGFGGHGGHGGHGGFGGFENGRFPQPGTNAAPQVDSQLSI